MDALSRTTITRAASDRSLPASALRVVMWTLAQKPGMDGTVAVSVTELAARLHISRASAWSALQRLREAGYLEACGRAPGDATQPLTYRIIGEEHRAAA